MTPDTTLANRHPASRLLAGWPLLTLTLILAVPVQAAEWVARFFAQPGSKVLIKGNNNLHEWEIQGDVIDGFVEFGVGFPIATGQNVKLGKVPAHMEGFIPVRSLHYHPGGATMDKVMYYALNEPTNPRIHFRFDELVLKTLPKSKETPYLFDSRCELVVAGVTNQISMSVGVLPLGGKHLKITGSTSIKMTDWGIKPPEAQGLSGSKFKTADEIKVSFEWLVGPKPGAERTVEMQSDTVLVKPNPTLYYVQASGGYTPITNLPSSNPVYISFVRWETHPKLGPVGVFRLTNAESHAIWFWNIRSQVRSTGPAADPSGWKTVTDDFPLGPGTSHFSPGQADEFWAKRPDETPWRVCILYSIDWEGIGKRAWGNYEVISEEMKE